MDSIKLTRQLETASIGELNEYSVELGWDAVYSQLGPTVHIGNYSEGISDSLIVTREGFSAALSVKTSSFPGYIALALYSSPKPATMNGNNLRSDRFILASPDAAIDLITRARGDLSLVLFPESELETRMGESYSSITTRMLKSPLHVSNIGPDTKPFARWFQNWSSIPLSQDQTGHASSEYHLNECINHALHDIAEAIEPADRHTTGIQYDHGKIARLIDYFHANPLEMITIEKMMQLTGLPRRNLFYLFKQYSGHTPRQYFSRIRLAYLRKELKREAQQSLTTLTQKYNFFHPGEFSAFYKSVYGELPSKALRARRQYCSGDKFAGLINV